MRAAYHHLFARALGIQGDLSLTLLFGRHSKGSSHYKHGQFRPPKASSRILRGVMPMHDANTNDVKRIDDHYSPVTPEDYFRYRIAKMIRFYQVVVC